VSSADLVATVPALVIEFSRAIPRRASCLVTCFTIDEQDRIDRIYSVPATPKLTAMRFAQAATPA
jgi:hypothetical protein